MLNFYMVFWVFSASAGSSFLGFLRVGGLARFLGFFILLSFSWVRKISRLFWNFLGDVGSVRLFSLRFMPSILDLADARLDSLQAA